MHNNPLPIVISRSVVVDFVSLQALPKLPSPSTSVPEPPVPEPQSPPTPSNEAVESPSISSLHPRSDEARNVSPFEYDGDSPTLGSNAQIQFRMAQVTETNSMSPESNQHKPPQVPTRLTVHQSQMESFESSFPADLVVPSQYKISKDTGKAPMGIDGSKTHTPTQADFPPRIGARKPAPGAIKVVTGTVGSSPNAQPANSGLGSEDFGPAGAATSERLPQSTGVENEKTPTSGAISFEPTDNSKAKEDLSSIDPDTLPRPFSFIHFGDIPSDQLAIKTPVTPKDFSFRGHNRIVSDQSYFQSPVTQDNEPDWEAPVKRPSGKRKPGSYSQTRPEEPSRNASDGSSGLPQGSSLRSYGSRRIGDPEGQRDPTPPTESQRRRQRSRPLSDALDEVDESPRPDSSTIPGLIARKKTNEQVSPQTARKPKRGSFMNSLGGRTVIEESPKENPSLAAMADPQSRPPDSVSSKAAKTEPVKYQRSKSKTLLLRSSSSNAAPAESSTTPEKGKKKRFSGISVSEAATEWNVTDS